MKKFDFKNVVRKDQTKRMLKLTKQNPDSLEANIEEVADNIIETGTPINAEVMNTFQDTIALAEQNSITAKTDSSEAKNIAGNAANQANSAFIKSEEAIEKANNANTKADEALERVVQMQGTKVLVDGNYVSTFDANSKADKTTTDTLITNNTSLENRVTTIETNVKNIKNVSDTETNLEGTIIVTGTLVI